MRLARLPLALLLTAPLTACGSDRGNTPTPSGSGGSAGTLGSGGTSGGAAGRGGAAGAAGSGGAAGDGLPASCNPLRTAGTCFLPFPSAIYEAEDATTKTGVRLALLAETLPTTTKGEKLDPARYNVFDGFSPATPILVQFPEYIDASSLDDPNHIDQSLTTASATLLVDMTGGMLVPHFSEVDAQASETRGDLQTVFLRPAVRLAPGHRYAVAITDAIRTTDGKLPTAPPQYAQIVSGNAPPDALSQAQAARMPAILAALQGAGIDPAHVILSWDFVTGSDESITSHVLSMREQTMAMIGTSGLGYTITSVDDNNGDPDTLRRIRGTFTVPRFLSQTDVTVAETSLLLDAQGNPAPMGTYEAPFTALIPKAAATASAPLPVVLYGHGLFNSAEIEISGPWVPSFANKEGFVMIGTDWTGLSRWESPLTQGGNGAAAEAVSNFDHLPWVTDRLQQALVNAMTLVRTTQGKIVKDPAMTISGMGGGKPAADASTMTYFGISLGGIMGASFLGYDADVTRGVLNVGGGEWSLLFQRSVDWLELKLVIGGTYPDAVDQQILLALAQMQFDYTDPINVAPHMVAAPLPGTPAKQVLMQMGVGDCQVSNLSTELMARTTGIPLLAVSPFDVWGLTQTPGPLPSALAIWDPELMPLPPLTNATPKMDNGVHEAVRRIGKAEDQVRTFLTTGQAISTCKGACLGMNPLGGAA